MNVVILVSLKFLKWFLGLSPHSNITYQFRYDFEKKTRMTTSTTRLDRTDNKTNEH